KIINTDKLINILPINMDVFLYCGLTNFVIKKKKINEHPFKTRVKVPSANSLFVARYTQIATTNTNSPSRIPWNILANIIFLTLALRFTSLQAICKQYRPFAFRFCIKKLIKTASRNKPSDIEKTVI